MKTMTKTRSLIGKSQSFPRMRESSPLKTFLLSIILFALMLPLSAETYFQQGFEDSAADTWSYTANPPGSRYIYWGRMNQTLNGVNAQAGSWYWASWDLDNIESSLTFDNLTLPLGFTYSLSFYYYSLGLDPATEFSRYSLSYDDGASWSDWVNLLPDAQAWTLAQIEIPAYNGQVQLKVSASHDGIGKYAHWDSFTLSREPLTPTAPIVYNINVAQRTDGSGMVDILYDLFDPNGDPSGISILLSQSTDGPFDYTPSPQNLSGDLGSNIANGTGKHIVWDSVAEGIAYDGNQYRVRITADDGTIPENFVLVEGGTFNNGTSNVTISSFYIDKYELTQAGYQAVMGTNPASGYGVGATYPVYYVSWFNAIEYCNRRSLQEALTPCYSYSTYGTNPDSWPAGWNISSSNHTNVSCNWTANGYRLPTEMEWMFAAKGGNQSQGYTYSGSNDINAVAWYSGNSGSTTHTVGTKAPNELGTFDMSGNVWEWVWDIYGDYPSSPQTDPHGATSGSYRVVRGGGWGYYANYCTVSGRGNVVATYSYNDIGFRVSRVFP